MECQVEKNVHFRHLLLFAFNRGFTAAKAAREICVVYGENAMAERTARYWFAKFKEENFDLKDAPPTDTRLIWHQQIFTFLGHFRMLCVGFRSTMMQN